MFKKSLKISARKCVFSFLFTSYTYIFPNKCKTMVPTQPFFITHVPELAILNWFAKMTSLCFRQGKKLGQIKS